jgi:uncharacterized membrane protein
MAWYNVVRWIHILAATSWFGAVVLINVAIVPALKDMDKSAKAQALSGIFPRIFRFASVVSLITVGAGSVLFYQRFHQSWSALWETPNGLGFLVGATLAVALTLFHFFLEPRLAEAVRLSAKDTDEGKMMRVVRQLRIVPRGGLAVIAAIVILMMYGSRGL